MQPHVQVGSGCSAIIQFPSVHGAEAYSVAPAKQADALILELDVEKLIFHAISTSRFNNLVHLDA